MLSASLLARIYRSHCLCYIVGPWPVKISPAPLPSLSGRLVSLPPSTSTLCPLSIGLAHTLASPDMRRLFVLLHTFPTSTPLYRAPCLPPPDPRRSHALPVPPPSQSRPLGEWRAPSRCPPLFCVPPSAFMPSAFIPSAFMPATARHFCPRQPDSAYVPAFSVSPSPLFSLWLPTLPAHADARDELVI